MSKLTALRKQIAALEAQAERVAKAEMSSAIAKVKDIMAEFNLTIEHLTQAIGSKRVAKKSKTKAKTKTASVAKYVDPKTGKTWSGVGRAPAWIAGSKNRDAFLVANSTAAQAARAPAKKGAAKTARKVAKPAATKAGKAMTKRASAKATPVAANKRPAARKAGARKAAPKAAAPKRAAQAPADPSAAPAA